LSTSRSIAARSRRRTSPVCTRSSRRARPAASTRSSISLTCCFACRRTLPRGSTSYCRTTGSHQRNSRRPDAGRRRPRTRTRRRRCGHAPGGERQLRQHVHPRAVTYLPYPSGEPRTESRTAPRRATVYHALLTCVHGGQVLHAYGVRSARYRSSSTSMRSRVLQPAGSLRVPTFTSTGIPCAATLRFMCSRSAVKPLASRNHTLPFAATWS